MINIEPMYNVKPYNKDWINSITDINSN